MDFRFTEEQQRFRAEIREFLKKELTPEFREKLERESALQGSSHEFSHKVAEKGWIGLAWPREYGGKGLGYIERLIYNEEMVYWRAPIGFHLTGDRQTGPSIIAHGSEEQKRYFLPRIIRAELSFCLGYSEPGAGSDLASLQTRAVADGDDFIINGQKVWTSGAHTADYCWLAVRTDPNVPKHRGISVFILDMKLHGIKVRPLENMTGAKHFCEVFFDDLRVPKMALVGEMNQGWYYIAQDLDYERSGIERVIEKQLLFEELLEHVGRVLYRGQPLSAAPLIRHRLAEIAIEFEVGRLLAYRVAWMMSKGLVPNYEASISKAFGSELGQRFAQSAMLTLGFLGLLHGDSRWAPLKGKIEQVYLSCVSDTIRGGTSEIMRNVVAQRGLGLPR